MIVLNRNLEGFINPFSQWVRVVDPWSPPAEAGRLKPVWKSVVFLKNLT